MKLLVEQGSQKAGVAVASPLREPAKPTMLIVDDDEDMRQFVKAHFEKMYTVYTADNGKDALRKLEKHPVSAHYKRLDDAGDGRSGVLP